MNDKLDEDDPDKETPEEATAQAKAPGLALERVAGWSPLAAAVAAPTWPLWGLAVGLLLQMGGEWHAWNRSAKQRWLTAAAVDCQDVRAGDNVLEMRRLVECEATVYRAFFLETVRRRMWVRLVLASVLAVAGLCIGLYRLRSETNFAPLSEVGGAALAMFLAALVVLAAAVLTASHAEAALERWHGETVNQFSAPLTASTSIPGARNADPADEEDKEEAGLSNLEAKRQAKLKKIRGR